MASILYPWKTTSIIKDAASVIQPPKKGGKGQGSGGGSVGKGGQGKGLGKGRGGGAGVGSTPPSSGGGLEPPVTTDIILNFDAQDTSKIFADAGKTITITDGTTVGAIDQTGYIGGDATSNTAEPTWVEGVLNGNPVFRTSATNQDLRSSFATLNSATDGFTAFLVYDNFNHGSVGGGTWKTLMGISGSSGEGTAYFGSFSLRTDHSSLTTAWASPISNSPNLIYSQLISGDVEISVNAGSISTTTGTSGKNFNYISIGNGIDTATADFGQLLVYKGTLSDTDRDAVITWLSDRWGLGFV